LEEHKSGVGLIISPWSNIVTECGKTETLKRLKEHCISYKLESTELEAF
jgi:hypothetical protein